MMNQLRPRDLIIGMAAVFCLSVLPLAAQQRLALSQAVASALEHNPELAIDAPARRAAQSEYLASRAGYLPRLDFEQAYTGGNNPVYVFGTLLSQRRFTAPNFTLNSLNTPDAIDNLQSRFQMQQTVFDFGRTRHRRESARLGIELADRGHEDHVRQVLLDVLDAYYSVSLARESWEAARVALESAEAIMKQARSRVESGLAVEADLLRGQVHLASAHSQEIQSRGQLEIAKALLNRLMGKPLDALLGETAALTPWKAPLPEESVLLSLQRQHRPDYHGMLTEVRQAELEVRSRSADFMPVIDAFAGWEADNPALDSTGGHNWTAGLSLRWNIFAGGSTKARLQAAGHRLKQKRRQLTALESVMALEIHSALLQCRSAEQQVQATTAAEAQSEESLRILKNRYDAGLATMTDLLSSETSRAEARRVLAEAIYRHRVSFAQMESAAGILSPTSTSMSP